MVYGTAWVGMLPQAPTKIVAPPAPVVVSDPALTARLDAIEKQLHQTRPKKAGAK
jgi:hypothetical protein